MVTLFEWTDGGLALTPWTWGPVVAMVVLVIITELWP